MSYFDRCVDHFGSEDRAIVMLSSIRFSRAPDLIREDMKDATKRKYLEAAARKPQSVVETLFLKKGDDEPN